MDNTTLTISRQTSGHDILKILEGYLPREHGVIDRRMAYGALHIISFMTVDKFDAEWPDERAFHGITSWYVPLREALLYSKAPIVTTLAGMLRGTRGFAEGHYESPEDMAITMLNDFVSHFKRYCDGYRARQSERAMDEVDYAGIEAVF